MTERELGGRYELAELLGQGGMAEVFRGRDSRLGRNVAVKLLRRDLARDPSFERRFEREAQAAAGMQHPNVVAVYDTGAELIDGVTQPYIVMEYIDGSTLKELISTGRRLLPQRALEITAGVLNALDYSHQRGVVHRDIKPGNVMLTRNGDVKVMDFGIARAVDDGQATMTQASTVMGTAQYLSPEQGRGETADERSDLYATGVLLYELLTGRPPFTGDTTESVIYQHVRENPLPPSQVDPEVPAAADAIVMKAMAKNPANRYQTAAEMRADILRAVQGDAVLATPVLAETAAIPAATAVIPLADDTERDRNRWGYWALLAAVLAALALAGFFLLRPLFNNTPTVQVPDLIGLEQAAAEAALEAQGLTLGTITQSASDQPKDRIIEQNPAPATEAEEGTTVDVVISSGPAKATVPAIIGLSLDRASEELERAGLTLGKRTERESDRAAGTVIDSDPKEGENVDTGTAVDVIISSGKVTVPDVVGDTESAASKTLRDAGFDVAITRTKIDPTGSAALSIGRVISQSPEADVTARAGSTVTIVVGEAGPTPAPTVTQTIPAPTAPSTP
jgi:serine/threonine-protein kinase